MADAKNSFRSDGELAGIANVYKDEGFIYPS